VQKEWVVVSVDATDLGFWMHSPFTHCLSARREVYFQLKLRKHLKSGIICLIGIY